jgi:hypothetical protein
LATFEPGRGAWAITVPRGRELKRELKRGCSPSRLALAVTAAFERLASRGTRTAAPWRLVSTTVRIIAPSSASTSAKTPTVRLRPEGLRSRRWPRRGPMRVGGTSPAEWTRRPLSPAAAVGVALVMIWVVAA